MFLVILFLSEIFFVQRYESNFVWLETAVFTATHHCIRKTDMLKNVSPIEFLCHVTADGCQMLFLKFLKFSKDICHQKQPPELFY